MGRNNLKIIGFTLFLIVLIFPFPVYANNSAQFNSNELELFYKFENNVLDNSGNNKNGTIMGTPQFVPGKIGNAINLSWQDYVYYSNVDSLDFERTDSFSGACWIRTSNSSQDIYIFAKEDSLSPYRGWSFYTERNSGVLSLNLRYSGSNRLLIEGITKVTNGKWIHVAFTYDGLSSPLGIKLYINGQPEAISVRYNALTSTVQNNAFFTVGSRNGAPYYFDGKIDEIAIFNRVLTPSEILDIYQNGVNLEREVPIFSTIQLIAIFGVIGLFGLYQIKHVYTKKKR